MKILVNKNMSNKQKNQYILDNILTYIFMLNYQDFTIKPHPPLPQRPPLPEAKFLNLDPLARIPDSKTTVLEVLSMHSDRAIADKYLPPPPAPAPAPAPAKDQKDVKGAPPPPPVPEPVNQQMSFFIDNPITIWLARGTLLRTIGFLVNQYDAVSNPKGNEWPGEEYVTTEEYRDAIDG